MDEVWKFGRGLCFRRLSQVSVKQDVSGTTWLVADTQGRDGPGRIQRQEEITMINDDRWLIVVDCSPSVIMAGSWIVHWNKRDHY